MAKEKEEERNLHKEEIRVIELSKDLGIEISFKITFGDDRKKFYEKYNHFVHIKLIDLLKEKEISGLMLENPIHKDLVKDIHSMLKRELDVPPTLVNEMFDIEFQEEIQSAVWDLFEKDSQRFVDPIQEPIYEYFQLYYYENDK